MFGSSSNSSWGSCTTKPTAWDCRVTRFRAAVLRTYPTLAIAPGAAQAARRGRRRPGSARRRSRPPRAPAARWCAKGRARVHPEAALGWISGWFSRNRRASSPTRATTASAVLSPSSGVGTRTIWRMLPTLSTSAAWGERRHSTGPLRAGTKMRIVEGPRLAHR